MTYTTLSLDSKNRLFITNLISGNKSRSLPVSLALARLISQSLAIPTVQVNDISDFYNTNYAVNVLTNLNVYNENILILDIDLVSELIYKFYCYRYYNVYNNGSILMGDETPVMDFFGISKFFDQTTIDAIKDNSTFIMECTLRFTDILAICPVPLK